MICVRLRGFGSRLELLCGFARRAWKPSWSWMNVDLVIEYVTRHDLVLMIFGQGKRVLCMRKERVTFK